MVYGNIYEFSKLYEKFKEDKRLNKMLNYPVKDMVKSVNRIDIPILYINLNESVERRHYIDEQLKYYEIKNFKRISGINGKNLTFPDGDLGFMKYNAKKKYFDTEYGCFFSHIKAIRYAYKKKWDNVLIIEDDCDFTLMDYWYCNKLSDLFDLAPKNWEVLQLFTLYVKETSDKYLFANNGLSSCAYIFNKAGINHIMERMEKLNKNGVYYLGNVDILADHYIYANMKAYRTIPMLFVANSSSKKCKSTIKKIHDNNIISICHNLIHNIKLVKDFGCDKSLLDVNMKFENIIKFYKEGNKSFYVYGDTAKEIIKYGHIKTPVLNISFNKNKGSVINKVIWRDIDILIAEY